MYIFYHLSVQKRCDNSVDYGILEIVWRKCCRWIPIFLIQFTLYYVVGIALTKPFLRKRYFSHIPYANNTFNSWLLSCSDTNCNTFTFINIRYNFITFLAYMLFYDCIPWRCHVFLPTLLLHLAQTMVEAFSCIVMLYQGVLLEEAYARCSIAKLVRRFFSQKANHSLHTLSVRDVLPANLNLSPFHLLW